MWPSSGDDQALEIGYAALASRLVVRTVAAGPPDGLPVLLLHGWACSAFLFRHNLAALARGGFRAIAVDLKGHGLSDKPEADGEYTLDAMTAHALEILDALALRAPVLVGQSMGGRLAMEVARRAPSRVRALVLIAPVGIGDFQSRSLLRLGGWRALEPLGPRVVTPTLVRLALSLSYGEWRRVNADAVEGYFAPMQYAEFPRVLQRMLREFAWQPIGERELAEITAPILMILGTLDRIIRVRRDHPLLRERPGLRVEWIEGAGHAPNEERPVEVNEAMLSFLKGLWGP